jgi:hypothetical protein
MPDPEDVVSSIFSLAVLLVVIVVLYTFNAGGDLTRVTNIVSSLAVPFILTLIGVFVILQIIQVT